MLENERIVNYPPMINKTSECKNCYANKICSLAALSIEEKIERRPGAGQFPVFQEMQEKLSQEIKAYFKKFVECISLE